MKQPFGMPSTGKAVDDFANDWAATFITKYDLMKGERKDAGTTPRYSKVKAALFENAKTILELGVTILL